MRLATFSATLLLLLIPHQSSCVAAFCCRSQGVGDTRSPYVHHVAIFGKDRRRTVEEFTRDNGLLVSAVERRFAATGTITCPYHGPCGDHPDQACDGIVEGSAQLTLKADVIPTLAHLLANEGTCEIVRSARSCTFSVQGPSQNHSIRVERLLDIGDAIGAHCPTKETYRRDWAMMKLAQPVPDVTPYGIDLDRCSVKDPHHVQTFFWCQANSWRDLLSHDLHSGLVPAGHERHGR